LLFAYTSYTSTVPLETEREGGTYKKKSPLKSYSLLSCIEWDRGTTDDEPALDLETPPSIKR
jgi:hypothetical protein